MSEKRKPTYQEIIKLCNKKDKEIERLQEENKDLKTSNIYLSKTCDRYKIEVERLNNEIGMKDFDIEAIEREVKNRDMYIEKLEKAYCKEIERLNSIIEKLEQENAVLKTQVVNKDKYSYGIRMGSDKE